MSRHLFARILTPLALAASALACAGTAASTPTTIAQATFDGAGAAAGANRLMIVESEIDSTRTESVYEMIQRLRPEYLRPKKLEKFSDGVHDVPLPPLIFVNGAKYGDLNDLRAVLANEITSVRFYPIEQAKIKFGMQYESPIIVMVFKAYAAEP